MNPLVLVLMIGLPLAGQAVSGMLRRRFVLHSRNPMPVTGAETARRMLYENGIEDVRIVPTRGQLTDHYDPRAKTVALSQVVFDQANVAACAVAAHECGHAVQHATSYPLLGFRSGMVPLLKLSNAVIPFISIGGAAFFGTQQSNTLAYICLAMLSLPTLFSLVTLPVEFDASRRALKWMESSGLTQGEQHSAAKNALWWAAMTYVVAALGSIVQVLYFAQLLLGGRRSRR